MMNYAYILGDEDRKVCAIVDPGWSGEQIIAAAMKLGWKIEKILLTHSHFDHSNALDVLVRETGAEVYIHEGEAKEISAALRVHPTKDGEKIEVGDLEVLCIHTPGHTPGSQCFLVAGALITGDTLFVDGCGRVDLPGSDPKKMHASLRRISELDPNIIIYPGHDYGPKSTSTIGEQRKTNPYMNATSERLFQ